MAEETQAGWGYQQSTSGFLPEGLEDPAEVSRSLHRWICVAFFYHKRGSISHLRLKLDSVCVCGCVFNSVFHVDDSRRDQVRGSGGVRPEPRPSARVPAAACGDCDGSRSGS